MKKKSTCFVIMGYGVKTDYATGRVLDLDKTYENIIKPAAEGIGLECKRADEIRHSGNIDVPMYQSLLSADIVIADLSTYNANAFYELGVRHALRPFTTIAIAESELKKPFDLDHTVIRSYEHLGNDIGYSEVIRFRKELQDTIKEILSNPQTDSPVYTFLSNLQQPKWENVDTSFEQKKESEQTLSKIIEKAKNALDKDNFIEAKTLFSYAHSLDEKSIYVIQKLALSTYKSKTPNH
ncbi:TRAFs-binding domain-containing protein, partial [Bacillus pumilus]